MSNIKTTETKEKMRASALIRDNTNRVRAIIKSNKERVWTQEAREKLTAFHQGRSLSLSTKQNMRLKARRGKNNHMWRGGVWGENDRIRHSPQLKDWRMAVFERDDYTCQLCGKRGGELHADHIKSFSEFSELRFEVSNGRTLCVPCHRKTDTYGRKFNKASILVGSKP